MSLSWLAGIIEGDGYKDDKHIEIYNSSPEIIKKSLQELKNHIDKEMTSSAD